MRAVCLKISFCAIILLIASQAYAQKTEVQYLSGTGSDHTVSWQFYCTALMLGITKLWQVQLWVG
jgi:hypothetical protein